MFGLEGTDEFLVKVVQTLKEACELLEVEFKYATDSDVKKIFQKRNDVS